jgi:hypothetical protein
MNAVLSERFAAGLGALGRRTCGTLASDAALLLVAAQPVPRGPR